MQIIDLNSDLGEGLGPAVDDSLLAIVSSANIACGAHAGDEATMRRTSEVAARFGVRIGAHPSYPDREGFGRIRVAIDAETLEASLVRQITGLGEVAAEVGARLAYVKPHGALYNDAVAGHGDVHEVLVSIAARFGLPLMTLPGSALERRPGTPLIREGFLDRAYRPDGTLVPRSETGALITDPSGVRSQAMTLASRVDSLSLHSDTPGAVALMREARATLESAGYTIAAT